MNRNRNRNTTVRALRNPPLNTPTKRISSRSVTDLYRHITIRYRSTADRNKSTPTSLTADRREVHRESSITKRQSRALRTDLRQYNTILIITRSYPLTTPLHFQYTNTTGDTRLS